MVLKLLVHILGQLSVGFGALLIGLHNCMPAATVLRLQVDQVVELSNPESNDVRRPNLKRKGGKHTFSHAYFANLLQRCQVVDSCLSVRPV